MEAAFAGALSSSSICIGNSRLGNDCKTCSTISYYTGRYKLAPSGHIECKGASSGSSSIASGQLDVVGDIPGLGEAVAVGNIPELWEAVEVE